MTTSKEFSDIVTYSLPINSVIEVREYLEENGKSPYKKWFDTLPATIAAKVSVALLRMEMGNLSSIKWFDGIGEFVLNTGPGYRIFLGKDGPNLIVLLGGGTKHRQQKDIERAKQLFTRYKARKRVIHQKRKGSYGID
jgi:putative addiction module killer protein